MKFTATALLIMAMSMSTNMNRNASTVVMAATSTGAATATFRAPRGISPSGKGAFFKDAEQQQQQQQQQVEAETLPLVSSRSNSHSKSATSSLLKVRGGNGNGDGEVEITFQQRMKIGFYFALWYFLNVVYNIVNKKLLNVVPAPVTIGTIQLGIGALYAALLWITGIRATPKLTAKGKETVTKVGIYHGSGQLFSIVSLGAGPVSFTHIVKALEPFFSAIVSALVFGKWMKPQVYATLIPVVGGVGYACLKERSFSWLAFGMAMASNISFALRAVVSKQGMNNYIGENMSSVNLFAAVTTASFFLCIPAAIISEKTMLLDLWQKATVGSEAVTTSKELMKTLISSGLVHYLNNEVMYLALSNVHPVTLAVGNTMKRVFIMVASVLVFRNPVSVQAGIGAAIGISGVLLYSLTKQHYEALEKKEAAEAAAAAASKGRGKGLRRGLGKK